MAAFTAHQTGLVVTGAAATATVESISKIETDRAMDIIQDREDKAFFAPSCSEVKITTTTGQRYIADNVTTNDDNSITANRIYPLANFGNSRFYLNQTTAATDNNIIYTASQIGTGTASTTTATNYITAGLMHEFTFNTNLNVFPAIPVTLGMPLHFGVSAQSKREQLQAKIRDQMKPDLTALFGHKPRAMGRSFRNTKANELVALGLLKSMLEFSVWKKYLTHHFVTVQGPSGLTYQIQRNSHNIIVWDRGTKISNLCVYIQDQSIPPTDEVIAKMLICMYDEPDIWERANISWKTTDSIAIAEITAQLGLPLSTTRTAFNFRAA